MVGTTIYRSQDVENIANGGLIPANTSVQLGPETAKNEVESWILNPNLIADLGDLSNKYIGSWNFPSDPTKLTRLVFGRTPRSVSDETWKAYYNAQLTALDIGSNCPLLNYLNIGKCTKLYSLDVSRCYNL
jgi:hypothetical protein